MSVEKKSGRIQGPHLLNQQLEEIGIASSNEINIMGVHDAGNRCSTFNEETGEFFAGKTDDIKRLIKKEACFEDPIIRGFVEIAKGKKLALVVTPYQEWAFSIIYDTISNSRLPYYASVKGVGKKPKEIKDVLIKFIEIKPKTVNHFIISEGLAKKLGVENGQDIRITKVYQKNSDINLDKL